jgi:ubiquinone/menaquinone biosynthesis C-methylase UbiE
MSGLYARAVFPWLLEFCTASERLARERVTALKPVYGEVLEVGFGTGLNLPHYPPSVSRLVALDPMQMLTRRVSKRIAAAAFPVERVQQVAEHLPFDDQRFDCVVSTLTLCTVRDPVRVVREIRRVLRPGGIYVFLEHGRSESPRIARLQNWLNPLWKCSGIGCGCNINRPIDRFIIQSGLQISSLERFALGRPRLLTAMYRGFAKA